MTVPFNPSKFADMLDEGAYKSGVEAEEPKNERKKLIKWLRKKAGGSQTLIELADKLERCRPRRRCRSAACPECAVAAQQTIAQAAPRFLKSQITGKTLIVCVSIVPADGLVKSGGLNTGAHNRAIRRWKATLARAGIDWFVGGVDVSFNEHKQARHRPRWSQHIYGLTVTENVEKLKQRLKDVFPRTKVISRPVKVDKWDGDAKALRYIVKPNFWRRITTDHGHRRDKEGTTRKCRDTDKQPLKAKQRRELLVHLDDIGIQARLLFRFCQLVKKPNGVRIIIRRPKGQSR
jgi:hypothetical protein